MALHLSYEYACFLETNFYQIVNDDAFRNSFWKLISCGENNYCG